MKLQFLVDGDEEGEYDFLDLYLLEENIIGFFVPDDTPHYEEKLLNIILLNGERFTVIITKELTNYLDKKFKLK